MGRGDASPWEDGLGDGDESNNSGKVDGIGGGGGGGSGAR